MVVPCQFGGDPDCGSCGCIASMGLAAVGAHKLGGVIPVGAIFQSIHKDRESIGADRPGGSQAFPCAARRRKKIASYLSDDGGKCCRQRTPVAGGIELQGLLDLTERVGNDPLLTQASTGNSSAKLDGILWIKASGKWMAQRRSRRCFSRVWIWRT